MTEFGWSLSSEEFSRRELVDHARAIEEAGFGFEDAVAAVVVCGDDVERHAANLQRYVEAGFDHVYIHQVGPDQHGALDFYRREVLPAWVPPGWPARVADRRGW